MPKRSNFQYNCRRFIKSTYEDIFHYLKKHGFPDKDAFRGMNRVRKGRGLPVITEEMRTAEDSWIIKRCENVQSLPSKADRLEQTFFKLRVEKI